MEEGCGRGSVKGEGEEGDEMPSRKVERLTASLLLLIKEKKGRREEEQGRRRKWREKERACVWRVMNVEAEEATSPQELKC